MTIQAESGAGDEVEKSPSQWSNGEVISALLKRCRHAEDVMKKLSDDLGERGPDTVALPESEEYRDWLSDFGGWVQAMTEARVYWETYEGPSPLQFRLDDICFGDRSNEPKTSDSE